MQLLRNIVIGLFVLFVCNYQSLFITLIYYAYSVYILELMIDADVSKTCFPNSNVGSCF